MSATVTEYNIPGFPNALFAERVPNSVTFRMYEFLPDENADLGLEFMNGVANVPRHLYVERAFCLAIRKKANAVTGRIEQVDKGKLYSRIQKNIREYNERFGILTREGTPKTFADGVNRPRKKSGASEKRLYQLGLWERNLSTPNNPQEPSVSPLIVDEDMGFDTTLDIGAYAFQNIYNFQVGFVPDLPLGGYRCFLAEFSRSEFEDYDKSNIDIPLTYALFIAPIAPTVDSLTLLGLWNSAYGRLRYMAAGRPFPRGMGTMILTLATSLIQREVKPYQFMTMDALLNTRRSFTKKGITIYRLFNDNRGGPVEGHEYMRDQRNLAFSYAFYEKKEGQDDERYKSKFSWYVTRPTIQSRNIARYYQDVHFILISDLLTKTRQVQIAQQCTVCDSKAVSLCGACMITPYCSKKCQKKDWHHKHQEECSNK